MIESGNLNQKNKEVPSHKQWVMGFMLDKKSLLHSDDVEVKWSEHKAGEKHASPKANTHSKTLLILLKGKIKTDFQDQGKTVILEKEGDFVIWEKGVFHLSEVLEDSKAITIRWPSLSDQVSK